MEKGWEEISRTTTLLPSKSCVHIVRDPICLEPDIQSISQCPACPKTFVNGEYLHGHWQRRHPEYVTLIPSTAAVVSPVQNSPPPSTSTSPIVAPNKEISELKERLQTAEKQLQNEQQLLHSIMDKVVLDVYCLVY